MALGDAPGRAPAFRAPSQNDRRITENVIGENDRRSFGQAPPGSGSTQAPPAQTGVVDGRKQLDIDAHGLQEPFLERFG